MLLGALFGLDVCVFTILRTRKLWLDGSAIYAEEHSEHLVESDFCRVLRRLCTAAEKWSARLLCYCLAWLFRYWVDPTRPTDRSLYRFMWVDMFVVLCFCLFLDFVAISQREACKLHRSSVDVWWHKSRPVVPQFLFFVLHLPFTWILGTQSVFRSGSINEFK